MLRKRVNRGMRASAVVLGICFFFSILVGPSGAQTSQELESLRSQRKQAQREAAAQAARVDVQEAEVDELTAALDALQANVNAQEGRVAEAQRKLDDANARHAAAIEAVNAKQEEIVSLEKQLVDRAISSYVGQGTDQPSILVANGDPNQAVRMRSLVDSVTASEADLTDRLRLAEEDLEIEQSLADVAAQEADAFAAEREAELVELQEARDVQAAFTAQAEARLEELLHKQYELDQAVRDLTAAERKEKARLEEEARRLAEELAKKNPPPPSGGGGGSSGPPVSSGDIVNACGIRVNKSIQTQTCNMINAAAADGVTLSGGGYRSSDAQIALRKAHCGTSDYAIWQMPASRCRPPTARPGQSNHEKGLAIDFNNSSSRSSTVYKWLAGHASSYGFYNLPSEPWHWSVNGN